MRPKPNGYGWKGRAEGEQTARADYPCGKAGCPARRGTPASSTPPPERKDAPRPRNRAKWQAGQELRAYLRDLIRLLSCPCCHRPRFESAHECLEHLPDEMRV